MQNELFWDLSEPLAGRTSITEHANSFGRLSLDLCYLFSWSNIATFYVYGENSPKTVILSEFGPIVAPNHGRLGPPKE